ncbi:MAG: hypothetical protein CMK07_08920 [Ponticaulis sp.]|nr:hypothetical protein [Ponticaulis sp.]
MGKFAALIVFVVGCFIAPGQMAFAQQAGFDARDPSTDRVVAQCLRQKGIGFLPGTDILCYNSMIFAEHLDQLKKLGPASRVIFTSSGGNMLIARKMNAELSRRRTPVTIAGPCLSSCAMLIMPGLKDIHIHNTALIAFHGITDMSFERWWGWTRSDAEPSFAKAAGASFGFDDAYMFYHSAHIHMKRHFDHIGIDHAYYELISLQMEADARSYSGCRAEPSEYWTIISPTHVRRYLGASVTRMERFVSSWSDPLNLAYQHIGYPISNRSYLMTAEFDAAGCGAVQPVQVATSQQPSGTRQMRTASASEGQAD